MKMTDKEWSITVCQDMELRIINAVVGRKYNLALCLVEELIDYEKEFDEYEREEFDAFKKERKK